MVSGIFLFQYQGLEIEGHLTGESLPLQRGYILHFSEMEAPGSAVVDACGEQTLVETVHAIVTLDHLPRAGVPLRCSPGTGDHAAFAADAQGLIHEDDSVLGASLHGSGGARVDAPWLFAVEAWHKDEGGPRNPVDDLGAHRHDLRGTRAEGESLVQFAVNLAAVTSNAVALILK
jgi:hypothetical protein